MVDEESGERPANVLPLPERRATAQEQSALTEARHGTAENLPNCLDWEDLEERGDPPAREWAVEHWIGMGHVTLLAGRGGIGKSVLAQQWATAIALGKDFIGRTPQRRPVLMWAGEDDHDELWRRQVAICKYFDVSLGSLRNSFYLEPLSATIATLFSSDDGIAGPTAMLYKLAGQIQSLRAEVVILDNIAKLYGAGENNRNEVSTFISALNGAAQSANAAVLLLGHTAKPKDSEYSGTTAWENAARQRLLFADKEPDKLTDESPEDITDEEGDFRYLAKRKFNYTSRDICKLRYEAGAYVIASRPAGDSPLIKALDHDRAKRVVMRAATELGDRNIWGTDTGSSQTHLPHLIVRYGLADGFRVVDMAKAMRALILDGSLTRQVIGKYSNRSPKYGLKPAQS
jgi:RecA-family ATPase